jgi:hypothetical protein
MNQPEIEIATTCSIWSTDVLRTRYSPPILGLWALESGVSAEFE